MIQFLRKLFGKHIDSSIDIKTTPLADTLVSSKERVSVLWEPSQLIVGSAKSIGMQREHNEDSLFTLSAMLAEGNTNLPFGIFIIADGMGGHKHGEIASGLAAKAMAEYLVKHLYFHLLGEEQRAQSDSLYEIMENGVKQANLAVQRNASGGGTTLTAALVLGEQVTLAHVGDSRAYFFYPEGRMELLTYDHSLVNRLIELGQITEKEAAVHPQRNVLYRAIGQLEPLKPDINTFLLPNSGSLLLCSDGLWGVVPEKQINQIIMYATNPSLACHELIEAANDAGGPDNISVILVNYLD